MQRATCKLLISTLLLLTLTSILLRLVTLSQKRKRAYPLGYTLFNLFNFFISYFVSHLLQKDGEGEKGGEVKQHIQLVTIAVSGIYIICRRKEMTYNRRLPQIKENGAKNSCRDDKERDSRRKKSQVAKNLHQQKAECGATKGVQN